MKKNISLYYKQPKGYGGVVAVLMVGLFSLTLMLNAYRSSIRSLEVQRDVQLKLDYDQKEQAYLRAVVSLLPAYVANTMQDGSKDAGYSANVSWDALLTAAQTYSNINQSADSETLAALVGQGGLAKVRSANTGDTAYSEVYEFIGSDSDFDSKLNKVTAGLGSAPSGGAYPPPMQARGTIGSALTARSETWDSSSKTLSETNGPVLSSSFHYYGSGMTPDGVSVDTSVFPHFNLVKYPNIHFGYGQPGEDIVGRHNWWVLDLNFHRKDSEATHLASFNNKYVVSVYELPAQLAISSAAAAQLGAYANGAAWENVTVSGGVFASQVTTSDGVAFDRIASRKGVTLGSGTSAGGVTSHSDYNRETYEAANSAFYPISRSSDTARAMFVPINRGGEFFDRFAYSYNANPTDSSGDGQRLSAENWNEYSIGANQCAMKLDIVDVVSAADQTPTSVIFTYLKSGVETPITFTKGDNWDDDDPDMPFVTDTVLGRPAIEIHADRLLTWLVANGGDPATNLLNRSLVVNPDYVNGSTNVQKPTSPPAATDAVVVLTGAKDLTGFAWGTDSEGNYQAGFSLVTNLRFYFEDDFNVTAYSSAPAGVTTPYLPPCSVFAPEKRFGTSAQRVHVNYTGGISSLKESGTSDVLNFKSGITDSVDATKVIANLKGITHPADLPPVSMMNWLVVVQKVN